MWRTQTLVIAALSVLPAFAAGTTYSVHGTSTEPWRKIFGALEIQQAAGGEDAIIQVLGPGAEQNAATLAEKHLIILEGSTAAAHSFGFVQKADLVSVRQICDVHAPKMQIIWQKPEDVYAFDVPVGFQVFTTERWKGIPVAAGMRTKKGAVLWLATAPGPTGIERYPYLLQALVDLGLDLPARTTTLWAFFDSAYRIRADVNYMARRWRQSGIGVLHVAAWHNMEADRTQDEYLKSLIEACHRNAILVYAWLELPYISEKFWADNLAWREKTALGQDAQLDWRKLMNLQNADCHRAVEREVDDLLRRFDWDGVNIAELYFESLEGASNPARFTPMNDDVRREFKQVSGFDPKLLFEPASPYSAAAHPDALRKFLDFRAELASRMQADWLDVIENARRSKPYLDVVLTHIDDRLEPEIRDALGVDVARSLPLIQARNSTLLVEDPATVWNLGPERYSKLAQKYRELSPNNRQIGVDINVVERYQDVYPTKKQTGVELLEVVHNAASSFTRVALYFESSIERQDLALLPVAATTATAIPHGADDLDVDTPEPTRIAWQGPVELDGNLWPVQDLQSVLTPSGKHRLSPAAEHPAVTITYFNGEIRSALASKD
jgi:hypothetical protein